jgi:hypothetical protein
MSDLTRDQQEALQRRMEEITTQVHNLDTLRADLPVIERSRLSFGLTQEWLACYRKLHGGPAEN